MHSFKHQFIRRIHSWLALPLALLLIVVGLTGSAIAWMHEIDVFLNPKLLRIEVAENNPPPRLTSARVVALLNHLNSMPDYAHPSMLELPETPNDVLIAWYPNSPPVKRQVMVHPYTGAILGERNWGEPGLTRALLMPTLFNLHKQLLAGEIGKTIISINAIFLLMIVLSGLYLWWPVRRVQAWWKAMTISWNGSWKRFNFSLHRAAGFYCAPIFLTLAITGIYFNKPHWIAPFAAPKILNDAPVDKQSGTMLPLERVLDIANNQFPSARISRITLPDGARQLIEIRLHQPLELRATTGATRVTINLADGKISHIQDPLQARGWDRVVSYFFPLHSGELFGIAGKVFISLFGLMPLLFAISGTLIWLRNRANQKR